MYISQPTVLDAGPLPSPPQQQQLAHNDDRMSKLRVDGVDEWMDEHRERERGPSFCSFLGFWVSGLWRQSTSSHSADLTTTSGLILTRALHAYKGAPR